MDFKDFWHDLSADGKQSLAFVTGSSVAHLSNIANGHKTPGPKLCRTIQLHTLGKVTAAELRPDLFGPVGLVGG